MRGGAGSSGSTAPEMLADISHPVTYSEMQKSQSKIGEKGILVALLGVFCWL